MTNRTYKGARLDLEIYQGKSTIDYEISVYNDNGSEYDFSVYDSLNAKLYYRQHGELIISPTVTNSVNTLLLDFIKAQTAALQTREYWIEIYGEYVSGEQDLISYGICKNV
jgi:hypothetical protein